MNIYLFCIGWSITGIITNIFPKVNIERMSFNLMLCFLVCFVWQSVKLHRMNLGTKNTTYNSTLNAPASPPSDAK